MDLIRIGGKIISRHKIIKTIDKILEMRTAGVAQQEIANRIGVDRTFVSRLETIGEVRKGNRIAVIGFPIKNKEEILELLNKEGIEFSLIMTEHERWEFVQKAEGIDLFNTVMNIIAEVRSFDVIIVLGSNQRIRTFEAIFDKEIVGLEIGESPIEEDKFVDPVKVLELINTVKMCNFREAAK